MCCGCVSSSEAATVASERTGLDSVTITVLEGYDELESSPDAQFKKNATIVEHLYATRGLPPRFAYEAICVAAAQWLTHVAVVDFHGNHGSPDPLDEPAAPRYTESRMSRAGAMALASERDELPRLPIGLINGDLSIGGTSPPFDPARVVEALRAASAAGVSDDDLVTMIGMPAFPTGCLVVGDADSIAAGERTKLRVSSDIAIETDERGTRLLITRTPYDIGPEDVSGAIASRVDAVRSGRLREAFPELENELDLPLRDVRNESYGDITRVVCELLDGANAELCRDRILETWPATIEVTVQLRAPLATLVRGFVDDPVTQNEALALLLLSGD
jgi:DNA gyrase/topoisomerase IV subunit A